MAIAIGGNKINKAYLGTTEIQKMYLGSELVFDNSVVPIGLKPILTNFRIEEGQPSRVYFDTPSGEPTGLSTQGFILSDGVHTITGVDTSSKYFDVSPAFDHWDNETIRLENGDGTIYDFTLQKIINNIAEPVANTEIFVDLNVASSGDGTSEAQAFKTILEGMEDVSVGGTTIWIKSGDYGNEALNVWAMADVTGPSAPVKFIGYKTAPGDITTNYYDPEIDNWDVSEMPTITGTDRSTDGAFVTTSGRGYVIFRNLQMEGWQKGIYNNGEAGVIVDRCNAKKMGTTGSQGYGFDNNGNYCRIIDSNAKDCRYNIDYSGDHCLILNTVSYSNEPIAGVNTGYYYILDGEHNVISNAKSFRENENEDAWHGMSVHSPSNGGGITQYNLVEDYIGISLKGAELRHDEIRFNVFRNMEIYSEGIYNGYGIEIRDGAHDNIIENSYIHDVISTTMWSGSSEVGTGTAYNNAYRNCVMDNFSLFSDITGSQESPEIDGNKFINCTINDASNKLLDDDGGITTIANNEFISCNITNISTSGLTTGYSFTNCNFYNSFQTFVGATGNINTNPNYVSGTDFEPQTELPVAKYPGINYDYNSSERGNPTTIGAIIHADESITEPPSSELFTQDNAASRTVDLNAVGSWVEGGATVTSTDVTSYLGTYCMQAVAQDGGNDRSEFLWDCVAGKTYRVEIWAKRGAQTTDPRILFLYAFAETYETPITTTDWTLYSIDVVCNTTIQGNLLIYAAVSGAVGDTVFFDSVSIIEL